MPIGNLTSQIFANIYLNELDRFVVHSIKPQAYLRYGDDFIIIAPNPESAIVYRVSVLEFLDRVLKLQINYKNDIVIKVGRGLHFLGVEIFPGGRRLNKRGWSRAKQRLNLTNTASYSGIISQNSSRKKIKEIDWLILTKLEEGVL